MKRFSLRVFVFAFSAVMVGWLAPIEAEAQNVAYLSATGTATGANCQSVSTPCGVLFHAIDAAGDGGTVVCLTPGYYGNAASAKGYTLICPGGALDVLTISAPGKNVRISGVTFSDPFHTGLPGVEITNANSVTFENVTFQGPFPAGGIKDTRAGPGTLIIIDSRISDSSGVGILIVPSSGTITVALNNVSTTTNTYGLAVGAGGRVMIDRSMFSGNSVAGIEADGGAFIGVNNSLISSNNIGVQAGGTIALSNSDIKSNNTGISGATQTFGNNRFFANINDGATPTPVSQR